MLRIRTGARHGLRWGMFGFATLTAVLVTSSPHAGAAPYADIVVDANSGNVLQATNADARRHPASLTKIMTLYMLFEQLEAGKLKLDSKLNVSEEAADQAPTKLGLKPGSTIEVEDAIKGIITRSANDAAVVVAEAIAGDEEGFAKLMTRKALSLGMSRTVYRNASGLPDDDQVTTARDQATLGRAIQERFPHYYKYFSTRSFTFRGQWIGNHNRLLGKVEGVDGIKTGYIRSSGFNLVSSVRRGNRHLVAVIIGGSSASSRDAKMRDLISDKIAQASTKRTATMIAEASEPNASRIEQKPEAKAATKVEPKSELKATAKIEPKATAKAEPKATVKVEPKAIAKVDPKGSAKVDPKAPAKLEAKADPVSEPRFAIASAVSMPARFVATPPATEPTVISAAAPQHVSGSTDPIKPVLVKTVTVRAAAPPSTAIAALQVAPPRVESIPEAVPVQVAAAKHDLPTPSAARPAAVGSLPARNPMAEAAPAPALPAPARLPTRQAAAEPAAAPAPPAPTDLPARQITAEPAPPAPAKPPVRQVAEPTVATPAANTPAAKMQVRSGWMIQVGAYPAEQIAKQRLSAVQSKASKELAGANPFTETVDKGGTTYYRARFAGLDHDKAEAACKYLKKNDVDCIMIKN